MLVSDCINVDMHFCVIGASCHGGGG